MPKVPLILSLCLAAGIPAGAQQVADSPGVTVLLNGSTLLHRSPVQYPAAAREAGVQGTVTVDLTLDGHGNVTDARVASGPVELRRAVLKSVLDWHFSGDAANSTRQISVQFASTGSPGSSALARDFIPAVVVASRAPAGPLGRRISAIQVLGLPESAKDELLAHLPVHVGDILTLEVANAAGRAVREFDEHLGFGFTGAPNGETTVSIMAPGYEPDLPKPAMPSNGGSSRMQISPPVLQLRLRSSTPPVYPPLARQARIQGVVKLNATISKEGTVQNLSVVSGHPLLIPAALEAVKQWTYEPLLVNGTSVEIQSEIEVTFALSAQ